MLTTVVEVIVPNVLTNNHDYYYRILMLDPGTNNLPII